MKRGQESEPSPCPKKSIAITIIVILLLVLAFLPYLKAEVLTYLYGNEFKGLEQQTKMMDSASYYIVVEYSETQAKVFYVLSGKGGCVITFSKQNSSWEIVTWEMVWSHFGSADKFYWPYYM